MRNITEIDGTPKKAKAITEKSDCKLSYVVDLDITHIDNDGVQTTVKSSETVFKEKKALDARWKAFSLRNLLSNNSYIDGKLCEGHLDSPLEAKLKKYKNFNMLTLNIHCINEDDDFLTISEQEPNAPKRDELLALEQEYGWYVHYGYDTGGDPHSVEDDDGTRYEIINLANNYTSEAFFYIGKPDSIDEIQKNGIKADSNGNILFLTRKGVADNLVWSQYRHDGEYALVEFSARGITGIIKPYTTGEPAAFNERIVKQERIEPQYIKSIELVDNSEMKYYHDYYTMDKALYPERYLIKQGVPFSYLVSIERNAMDEYTATLGGTIAFLGYTVINSDVLFSRFLAMTKSEMLGNNPRITNDGKAYIQVHLWDNKKGKPYLTYDSRGRTKKILKNLKKEKHLLDEFIQGEQDLMTLKDKDGKDFSCIRSRWTTADVDPSFLVPISEDDMFINPSNPAKMLKMVNDKAIDSRVGLHRSYTPFHYDLFTT